MKKAFTFVEAMVVFAIIGLVLALAIPPFVNCHRSAQMKNVENSPRELNNYNVGRAKIIKQFEFKGYDIYTFVGPVDGPAGVMAFAIPVTNSVYDIERK